MTLRSWEKQANEITSRAPKRHITIYTPWFLAQGICFGFLTFGTVAWGTCVAVSHWPLSVWESVKEAMGNSHSFDVFGGRGSVMSSPFPSLFIIFYNMPPTISHVRSLTAQSTQLLPTRGLLESVTTASQALHLASTLGILWLFPLTPFHDSDHLFSSAKWHHTLFKILMPVHFLSNSEDTCYRYFLFQWPAFKVPWSMMCSL